MKILITGAGGFLGRNLTEYLSNKYLVDAKTHAQLDLTDYAAVSALFSEKQYDVVFHTATVGGTIKGSVDNIVEKNLRMFINLEKRIDSSTRLIVFGSGAEYDREHWRDGMTETGVDLHVPSDDYGFSKQLINRLARNSAKDVVNMRIFGLFGKYEEYRYKFISNCIIKKLAGMPIVINRNALYDYVYIDDFVRIAEKMMVSRLSHCDYNITSGKPVFLKEIAEIIEKADGAPRPVQLLNQNCGVSYTGSNERLQKDVGAEFTGIEKCIRSLYEYYSDNYSRLDITSIREDAYLIRCRNSQ